MKLRPGRELGQLINLVCCQLFVDVYQHKQNYTVISSNLTVTKLNDWSQFKNDLRQSGDTRGNGDFTGGMMSSKKDSRDDSLVSGNK